MLVFLLSFFIGSIFAADLPILDLEWSQPFLSVRLQNMLELSISEEGASELLFIGRDGLQKRHSTIAGQNSYSFRGKSTQGWLNFCGTKLCRFSESFYFGNVQAVQDFKQKFVFWQQILEEAGFDVFIQRRQKGVERFESVLRFKKDCNSHFLEGSIFVVEVFGNLFRGTIDFYKKENLLN